MFWTSLLAGPLCEMSLDAEVLGAFAESDCSGEVLGSLVNATCSSLLEGFRILFRLLRTQNARSFTGFGGQVETEPTDLSPGMPEHAAVAGCFSSSS